MKIVILNTSEQTGGAAVAANRLMKALRKQEGTEVTMLVRDRRTEDPNVVTINNNKLNKTINRFRFLWERLIIFISNRLSRENLFRVSIANTGTDISRHPAVAEADVIHIHWINQGFLSIDSIRKLVKTGKPVVWTLHDLWAATGICHYPGDCVAYETQCDSCPMQTPAPLIDLARRTFRKKKTAGLENITFVGCSRWIKQMAERSFLLQKAAFLSIPNPIDTEVFRVLDKEKARKALGLPQDKKLVLFGAANLADIRKGAKYLVEACQLFDPKLEEKMEIVFIGSRSEEFSSRIPYRVYSLGYLTDEKTIAQAYAACDLFVTPSLEDNLPNTVMESMACGTPCVGFRTGGIPEMIDHQENGYLATYKDAEDLARGIEWVLEQSEARKLSENCRQKVLSIYKDSVVARQYLELYHKLLLD